VKQKKRTTVIERKDQLFTTAWRRRTYARQRMADERVLHNLGFRQVGDEAGNLYYRAQHPPAVDLTLFIRGFDVRGGAA
jgi:hypothetical protein